MRETTYTIPDERMVIDLGVSERAAFITRTYTHLFGTVIGFVLVEMLLFAMGVPEAMVAMLSGSSLMWLVFLGGFVLVGSMASGAAHRAVTPQAQYGALFGFVLAEALIFAPLLWIANAYVPGAISSAALITAVGFSALTAIVFVTRKDFSFLRGILMWGGIVALLLIVGGAIFGFHLGMAFSVGMVALAGGMILYDTSNVLHHYPQDRHVAAALQLFASLALMFWYVLRIVMASRD